ncbi:MAG: alpha/beta fold hydrolase [Spirochaetes bacterium]|nr:alpha/beta fold hydrolase [Spirochaetota bacterium]
MKIRTIALAVATFAASAFAQAAVPAAVPVIDASWRGVWEGGIETGEGTVPVTVRVHERGVLVDVPGQDLYGFPAAAHSSANGLDFAMSGGGEPLVFECSRKGNRAEGSFRNGDANAPFFMVFSDIQPDPATLVSFDSGESTINGALSLPAGNAGRPPLVVLLAGAGNSDRNGNNYSVPGRNDALRQLAEALAEAGIASYRYDKRGAGESAWLIPDEESLLFSDFVNDAAACARSFRSDGRFGKIYFFGHAEGALVAAAAAGMAKPDGLIAACASGRGIREIIAAETADAPEGYRREIASILAELEKGRFVDEVSPWLERLFRRGFQPYLASWLRYDPVVVFPAARCPTLLLWGERDIQVGPEDFLGLQAVMPYARTVMVSAMNHVLKEVSVDVDENFASFNDPSFPLATGLVAEIVSFIGK